MPVVPDGREHLTGGTGARLARRLGLVLVLPALAACSSSMPALKAEELRPTDFRLLELNRTTEELRKDVMALRSQVDAVRTEAEGAVQGALQTTVQNEDRPRRDAIDALEQRLAAMEMRLEEVARTVRAIEMTAGGLADQVAKIEAAPVTPAKIEAVPVNPASPANATAGRRDGRASKGAPRLLRVALPPEELFERAMESFKSGELGQAVLDFEELVVKHPTHALAATAQFWIGEAYYDAREYQHAVVEYKRAVDLAPRGEKAPEALLKLGLANRALKRHDWARDAWNQLLREFPQSEAAQRARTALREVARPPRPGSSREQ